MPRVPIDQGGGVPGMMALLSEQSTDFPVFAPPFIRKDDILLSQLRIFACTLPNSMV